MKNIRGIFYVFLFFLASILILDELWIFGIDFPTNRMLPDLSAFHIDNFHHVYLGIILLVPITIVLVIKLSKNQFIIDIVKYLNEILIRFLKIGMNNKHVKFSIPIILIVFVNTPVVRINPIPIWVEDFESNIDDWTLDGYTRECCFIPVLHKGNSDLNIVNGSLTRINQSIKNFNVAMRNSSLAYGSWSFLWDPNNIPEYEEFDQLYFIFTDISHEYYWDQSVFYFISAKAYYLTLGSVNSSPGISLSRWDDNKRAVLGYYSFSSTIKGPHLFEITRNFDGRFDVYFDSGRIIQVTDNTITTSEKLMFVTDIGDSKIDNISVSNSMHLFTPIVTSINPIAIFIGIAIMTIYRRKSSFF